MTLSTRTMPSYDALMNPLVHALWALGGSGSIEEIYDKVVEQEKLSDSLLSKIHDPEKSTQSEIAYRLAWARTYLKKYGVLENSSRGIWALTSAASGIEKVNPREVIGFVRNLRSTDKGGSSSGDANQQDVDSDAEEAAGEEEWKQRLHRLLTQTLSPAAFERLVRRLLRESGFTQVEVTGRTGDGGVDGRGIARIHGLMSFHVLFQCKRYRGSVGAPEIRDF